MKQITSQHQVHDLRIGSIIVLHHEVTNPRDNAQGDPEVFVQYSVQGYTPIGWEDTELELQPLSETPRMFSGLAGSASTGTVTPISKLGSELISDRDWWID